MEVVKSKVYVKADASGRIVRCEGGYTTPADLAGWTEIDKGTGDRFNLAQSHYFPSGLYTSDGLPRYKLVNGQPVERTEEELETDRIPLQAAAAREKRDKLLAETDWTQTLDAPVTEDSKTALRAYRQALRDLPEQTGWPVDIEWPQLPKITKYDPNN